MKYFIDPIGDFDAIYAGGNRDSPGIAKRSFEGRIRPVNGQLHALKL
jgi:hypothetical protein